MWKLFSVFKYLKGRWKYAWLNVGFNILFAVFSVFSITAIYPFLQLITAGNEKLHELHSKPKPEFHLSAGYLTDSFNYMITDYIFSTGTSDADLVTGKTKALVFICLLVFVMTFFKNVFRYLAMYFIAPIRNGVVRDLRNKLHRKSLSLPLSYYSGEKKGDMMSRITNDVVEIEFGIMTSLESIFREPLSIILFLATMISISPILTLYVVLLVPLVGLLSVVIGKSLRRSSQRSKERLGDLFSILEETLGGIKIIKAFTGENFIQKKFESVNSKYYREALRVYRKTDLSSPLSESFLMGALMVILFIGGKLVINNEMSGAIFILYFGAAASIIAPIKQMTVAYSYIQKGLASEERIDRILKADNVIHDQPDAIELREVKGAVEYRDVSFAYHKGDEGYVLDNINLKIDKGRIIALVGESGSGKTTLADMLPRFYDCDAGEVLIDGVDIRKIKTASLRKHIGVVTQESLLFNDTVAANIGFGKENASQEEIIAAAKVANAHGFIEQLPDGYNTNIGDRGSKLSGGQRQRLSIARAVLRDPEILILDEATSALDTESERLVQDALLKLMKSRTSIVIAHRLSTIVNADEIVVLQKGRVIERGTHSELMTKNGAYKKLCELQSFE
jgi:ATP-binding cassette, subfamily B, bacterial MsbA